jgi:hypothetical protein
LALANRVTQLHQLLRQVLTLLSAHKSVHLEDALLASAHSVKLLVLQSSRTASVQLPLAIRAQRPTLVRVVLTVKKLDHQTARHLIHLPLQRLVNQTLDNQTLDSQMQVNQMLDSQTLDNQMRDSQTHNKVQLSTRMKLLAATQMTTEFLMHST